MIAFESGHIPDRRMVPRIHRYYRTEDCRSTIDHGRVFGEGLGSGCALLINASPGSLIQIVELNPKRGHMAESICRIGPDFEVVPVPSHGREISRPEIEAILDSSPVDVAGDLGLQDSDVRPLFSSIQPPWLQEMINAQLDHWKHHNVGLFFRYTAWPVSEDDLRRCVKAAPYWALARWKDRLQPFQLDLCVQNSPRGAVSFAIERLSPYLRERYLVKYPADALIHTSDKLAEGEVLRFADQEPAAAFSLSCRQKLNPRLRATVLANGYRKIRRRRMTEPELERDILDSIVGFPAEWLAAHRDGFAEIMGGLASRLSVSPEGSALIAMRDRLEPSYQRAFAAYIASLI